MFSRDLKVVHALVVVVHVSDHLDHLGVLLAQGLAAAQGGEGVVEARGCWSQPSLPLSPQGWAPQADHQRAYLDDNEDDEDDEDDVDDDDDDDDDDDFMCFSSQFACKVAFKSKHLTLVSTSSR